MYQATLHKQVTRYKIRQTFQYEFISTLTQTQAPSKIYNIKCSVVHKNLMWSSVQVRCLGPDGSMFEPHSCRHVGTLGKSFTGSAVVFWRVNYCTMRMLRLGSRICSSRIKLAL